MSKFQVNILDWVSKGSFKGDLEVFDKSGKGVGSIYVAVKFERPGSSNRSCLTASITLRAAHRLRLLRSDPMQCDAMRLPSPNRPKIDLRVRVRRDTSSRGIFPSALRLCPAELVFPLSYRA